MHRPRRSRPHPVSASSISSTSTSPWHASGLHQQPSTLPRSSSRARVTSSGFASRCLRYFRMTSSRSPSRPILNGLPQRVPRPIYTSHASVRTFTTFVLISGGCPARRLALTPCGGPRTRDTPPRGRSSGTRWRYSMRFHGRRCSDSAWHRCRNTRQARWGGEVESSSPSYPPGLRLQTVRRCEPAEPSSGSR